MSAGSADAATPRLHVLLTMWYLVHRSGAELFTRDLALWFRRRGHSVTVFAPILGEMADELRRESIACIADPAMLARRPDIIVGNTHNETVRAVLQFPDVPAVSICHDRSHEHGRPPRLSQVRRYVAVDENCKERLCHENGIDPGLVEVIQNGVDLGRFARRAPLPERPQRALVFSSYAQDDALLAQIRAACAEAGMQLDAMGACVDNLVQEPGALLGNYDLVFAKGRAATEALAVGCACILLEHGLPGMGRMVRSESIESARRWNFGRALLTRPITREHLAAAIAEYDPIDAAHACDWVRTHAGLDATGLALERLLVELVRRQPTVELAPAQQSAELLRYMRDWVEAGQPTGEHLLIAQLRAEVLQMHHDLNQQRHRGTEAEMLAARLQAQIEEAQAQNAELREQIRAHSEALDAHPGHAPSSAQQADRIGNDEAAADDARAQAMQDAQAREQALREHAQALQEREQALLASASWRITAPLRAGLNLIRKILG